MIIKRKNFLFLFLFYLNLENISTQIGPKCIQGENCPNLQGMCLNDKCVCMRGYQTVISLDSTNPIYCNYAQKSRWIALILELFIPSLGLFYLKRIMHAIIKLILMFTYFCTKQKANCFSIMIGLAFIVLYITDIVSIIIAYYHDGNGVPIL